MYQGVKTSTMLLLTALIPTQGTTRCDGPRRAQKNLVGPPYSTGSDCLLEARTSGCEYTFHNIA